MFTEEQEMYFSTMIILMAFFNLLVFKGDRVFNLHTISNIPVHSIILEKIMKATDLPRKVIHSHVCKKKKKMKNLGEHLKKLEYFQNMCNNFSEPFKNFSSNGNTQT